MPGRYLAPPHRAYFFLIERTRNHHPWAGDSDSEFQRDRWILRAFESAAEDAIRKMRAEDNYLERLDLAEFKRANSWETTQGRFLSALEKLKVAIAPSAP